jgi:hypothetical protein
MSDSRAAPGIALDGISPDEAFSVLGNEIRLDIIRVLWQANAVHAYDDVTDAAETISFSELRRGVDVDDNGKFNYHLSKLTPHFVRQTEDGYRLSGAGRQIARTVIAVSGGEGFDFPTDLERDCPLCRSPLRATYSDQWLRVRCTECEGLFGDEAPAGTVYLANYPAGGLADRSAEEAFQTGLYRCMLDNTYLMHGVCRECGGRIASSMSACLDHEDGDGVCSDCGTPFPAWAERRCETCGFAKRLPVELFVLALSPVIGALDHLGVDALAPSFDEVIGLLRDRLETTVSADPLRVSTTVDAGDTTLCVLLDGDGNVVGIDRSARD